MLGALQPLRVGRQRQGVLKHVDHSHGVFDVIPGKQRGGAVTTGGEQKRESEAERQGEAREMSAQAGQRGVQGLEDVRNFNGGQIPSWRGVRIESCTCRKAS